MKKCTKCGMEKPLEDFYADKQRKDGRQPWCKACHNADYATNREKRLVYSKAHYAANRERILAQQKAHSAAHREEKRAYGKAYHAAHREEHNARNKAYYAANRERQLAYDRLRRYGVTPEALEALLQAQQGRCAICGEKPKKTCVDHCHETGEVRGLLCDSCNRGLGYFKDSAALLLAAVGYLREWVMKEPDEGEAAA